MRGKFLLLTLLLGLFGCVSQPFRVLNPIELVPNRYTIVFLRYFSKPEKRAAEYANEMCYFLRQRNEEAYVADLGDEALVCLYAFNLNDSNFHPYYTGPDRKGMVFKAGVFARAAAASLRKQASERRLRISIEVVDLGDEAWVCVGDAALREARRALKALRHAKQLRDELYRRAGGGTGGWTGPALGAGVTKQRQEELQIVPTNRLIDEIRRLREARRRMPRQGR